jgi:hypothetical protein
MNEFRCLSIAKIHDREAYRYTLNWWSNGAHEDSETSTGFPTFESALHTAMNKMDALGLGGLADEPS